MLLLVLLLGFAFSFSCVFLFFCFCFLTWFSALMLLWLSLLLLSLLMTRCVFAATQCWRISREQHTSIVLLERLLIQARHGWWA